MTSLSGLLPAHLGGKLRIGCIGSGRMGGALLSGLAALKLPELSLCAYNRRPEKLEALKALGVEALPGVAATAEQ
ncbi:MAG: NAD(P)-binding domain-containing protein, partial [Desulfovibrio sp.]|nr:NAD(P)-binding domain-containing protein [Desulfovibrio sp.]